MKKNIYTYPSAKKWPFKIILKNKETGLIIVHGSNDPEKFIKNYCKDGQYEPIIYEQKLL